MLLVCWGKWRRKVEEGAEIMRKERVACLHCYNTMLMSVMRVMMLHVVHRRMKRNHYAQLHARVCAAALLPIAIERMAKHCQVARAIICTLEWHSPVRITGAAVQAQKTCCCCALRARTVVR